MISLQNKIELPVCFLNIGGISNITIVKNAKNQSEIISKDLGPGNCLIDSWVRKNTNNKFDKDGIIASSGSRNEIIFEQAQELYTNRGNKDKLSFDTNDFDISFVRGLSFEDGVTTLTDFTASIIGEELSISLNDLKEKIKNILICGGGRKNKVLIKNINDYLINRNILLKDIDDYNLNGDFIESQAFAYLAIRSFLNLSISFPNTTRVSKAISGGNLNENYQ